MKKHFIFFTLSLCFFGVSAFAAEPSLETDIFLDIPKEEAVVKILEAVDSLGVGSFIESDIDFDTAMKCYDNSGLSEKNATSGLAAVKAASYSWDVALKGENSHIILSCASL